MRKQSVIMALCLLLVGVFILSDCSPGGVITGSGPVVTQDFDMKDFTSVEVSSAFEVELIPSSTYSVSVTANENLLPRVDVTKSGDTLRIGLKGVNLNIGNSTLKAKVTLPELDGLELSGASRGQAHGFKSSRDFTLTVSGASTLSLDIEAGNTDGEISGASKVSGHLIAPETRFELSGASQLDLEGSAENSVLYISDASKANLTDFPTDTTYVNLSGASQTTVNVSGKLDADLSGASTLEYVGSPSLGEINVTDVCRIGRR